MLHNKSSNGIQKSSPEAIKKSKDAHEIVSPDMENNVGITVEDLTNLMILESVKGLGPQKFKMLHSEGLTPRHALNDPVHLPLPGKTGALIREELQKVLSKDTVVFRQRAKKQLLVAFQRNAKILTYWHLSYPKHLYLSNYPVPVLYTYGSLEVLGTSRAVACVGSRNIRSPYLERHTEFAELAADMGFAIVSGFALGADTLGHKAAYKKGGKTICVMPGGLDRPFPPENRQLWQSLLSYPKAAMVTEAPFGTAASGLTLRKRNKLIAALASGVLVSQTATDGGAMNAYRFALEQHKPVATFRTDWTKDTSGNQAISLENKVPTSVFPENITAPEEWKRWLLGLSSLI